MKSWHYPILSILAGVLLVAAIQLTSAPPRGSAVKLLPAPSPAPLVVYLTGAVNQPGLYNLPHGSRLNDAITAAGGLKADANSDTINLAALLSDGQKIHIPAAGEVQPTTEPVSEPDTSSFTGMVNINTASLEELQTLPGIGPTRAQQIIDYREQQGGFDALEDLLDVPGIGPATFEQMQDRITLGN